MLPLLTSCGIVDSVFMRAPAFLRLTLLNKRDTPVVLHTTVGYYFTVYKLMSIILATRADSASVVTANTRPPQLG